MRRFTQGMQYEDFYVDKEMFDFSEYSEDLKFYDTTTKKVFSILKFLALK